MKDAIAQWREEPSMQMGDGLFTDQWVFFGRILNFPLLRRDHEQAGTRAAG
jgi:hypothetical protein